MNLRSTCRHDAGELVHGVNSQWLLVDRVLAERSQCGGASISGSSSKQSEFFVKWRDLGYEACRCVRLSLELFGLYRNGC